MNASPKDRGIERLACVAAWSGTLLAAASAGATPSTTYWAPSTPYVQPFGVLHVTYDTYFRESALYPIDVGLEIGVLPFEKLQLEVGFDFFYPTFSGTNPVDVPILVNAKIGAPEDVYFEHSPGWSFGIFGVGFEKDVTDYDVLHLMLGKTLPYVGSLAVGGYYGLNEDLFRSSDGETERIGLMAGWLSPSIDVPAIDHINLTADVQTGRSVLGAAGGGVYLYFTPAIDLLTGPVFFIDPGTQPGGSQWMWTVQLDVDVDLKPAAESEGSD